MPAVEINGKVYFGEITFFPASGMENFEPGEWDKILVFEEGFPFNAEEHKRWLYTAATRAKEKLVIVRK